MGDQVIHVGPIGAGSVAKLVHNMTTYAVQTALAEVFTLGVKAGVEPVELWQAVRYGAIGRQRTFDRLGRRLSAAASTTRRTSRCGWPTRTSRSPSGSGASTRCRCALANMVLEEMTEALNRGWAERDSRSPMLLQEERAGVQVRASEDAIRAALDRDPPAS